jgi:hypothetical protein
MPSQIGLRIAIPSPVEQIDTDRECGFASVHGDTSKIMASLRWPIRRCNNEAELAWVGARSDLGHYRPARVDRWRAGYLINRRDGNRRRWPRAGRDDKAA